MTKQLGKKREEYTAFTVKPFSLKEPAQGNTACPRRPTSFQRSGWVGWTQKRTAL